MTPPLSVLEKQKSEQNLNTFAICPDIGALPQFSGQLKTLVWLNWGFNPWLWMSQLIKLCLLQWAKNPCTILVPPSTRDRVKYSILGGEKGVMDVLTMTQLGIYISILGISNCYMRFYKY